MANRSDNRGTGKRADGTFVPKEQLHQAGVKMSPSDVALVEARNVRRQDGGLGPAFRSALTQVEALLGWMRDTRTLQPGVRAQIGVLLDEPDVVADATLTVLRAEGQLRAAHQDELAKALDVPQTEVERAVTILQGEQLVTVRAGLPGLVGANAAPADAPRVLVLATEPPADGPGAARLTRLGLLSR